METHNTYDGWIGRDAYDSSGEKLGEIKDIYYDDKTGRPEWVAVKTGLFGAKHTFVPIHGSQIHHDPDADGDSNDSLRLAFDKSMIKEAPSIDPEGHMTPDEEQELWAYWGYDYKSDLSDHGYGTRYTEGRADKDFTFDPPTRSQRRETGAIGNVGLEEHTEEVPVKTTAQVEVPVDTTVRLRRYKTTEQKTRTVEIPYEETTEHAEVADIEARAGQPTTTKGAAQVGTSKPVRK